MSISPTPDIASLRREYTRAGLRRKELAANPLDQFHKWFAEASAAASFEPNAMVLGTMNDRRPSSRTVLLKGCDERGLVFFTNYQSRKSHDIAAHAQVSLLFPWYPLERQVAILGEAQRITEEESRAYFSSRPQGSRVGAWVSRQSSVIDSRSSLESRWQEMEEKFSKEEVPLPSFWGGFRVIPSEFEFWQGRENRLHDRFRYSAAGEGWTLQRLAP